MLHMCLNARDGTCQAQISDTPDTLQTTRTGATAQSASGHTGFTFTPSRPASRDDDTHRRVAGSFGLVAALFSGEKLSENDTEFR